MPRARMKPYTKFALFAGAAAVALTALVGVGYAHDRGDADGHRGWHGKSHGHHGGGHWGGKRGRHAAKMFDDFDADKDGKVTQAEVDARVAERIKAFDADGNGQLSLEEFQGLWLDHMRKRMVDGFQRFDDDGDAQVTSAEMTSPFGRFIERFDRDGDGAVSKDELRRKHKRDDD